MGKIDFNALKRQREQQEVDAPDEDNSELSQAYQSVWGASKEKVEYIELNRLNMFSDSKGRQQPFKIDHDKVEQIKLSAADIGIITPLIVRKYEGDYQIISGHHRVIAAKELNILSIPCVVRSLDDEEAYKFVIESNIQRMKMLPSEYSDIFQRYMEKRKDIDMTAQEIADKFGISKKSMYRYINLGKLIRELQEYADSELLNIDSIDIICAFSEDNQRSVSEFIRNNQKKVTIALAKKMAAIVKNYGKEKVPVWEFNSLLYKPKKSYKNKIYNNLANRYNIEYSEKELDEITERLLDDYLKKLGG